MIFSSEMYYIYVELAEEFWLEQERFAGEIWFGADREGNINKTHTDGYAECIS